MNKIYKLLSISLVLLFFISCNKSNELLFERTFFTMGSKLEIKLYTKNEEQFNKITNRSIERAEEINLLFSNYIDTSVLAKVNKEAGKKTVEVPDEFIRLTQMSIDYSKETFGAFDITVGNLFELWKSKGKQDLLPNEEEIKNSLECIGFDKIQIDGNKISFKSDCLTLDFGAIGKGYVVDEIFKIAKEAGVSKGLINFGGNIYSLSTPDGKKYWEVGIRRPKTENEILAKVKLKDLGAATSGDYEKYFEVDGVKYSHILDPNTGYPVKDISSVTVISKSATESDVYSTAISVLGFEGFQKLKKKDELGLLFITKESGELISKKSEYFKKVEVKN